MRRIAAGTGNAGVGRIRVALLASNFGQGIKARPSPDSCHIIDVVDYTLIILKCC